jgi:phage terminase large subunit
MPDWLDVRGLSAKQREFVAALTSRRQPVVLYGGSGASGKSYALRTAAVYLLGKYRSLGFPGQKVMLACSSYPLLRDRHINKFAEEMAHMGRVVEDRTYGLGFRFRDESLGRVLFRNLDEPNKYRGTEVAAALVDELTELPETIGGESTIGTLLYPIRSPKPLPFLPFGAGSNPDGVGYGWVKRLFIEKDTERYGLSPEQVVYVRALVEDNPAATPEMVARLKALPDRLRRARLYGSWDEPEGSRWPFLSVAEHLYDPEEAFPFGIPEDHRTVIAVDYGIHAPFCALWLSIAPDGTVWVYRELYQSGLTASAQARAVAEATSPTEPVVAVFMDPAMWQRAPEGPSAADAYARVFSEYGLPMPEPGYNESRAQSLGLLDRYLERGNGWPDVRISRHCRNLLDELRNAVWDTRGGVLAVQSEDIDPRCADHAITALYYGLSGMDGWSAAVRRAKTMPSAEEARARIIEEWYAERRAEIEGRACRMPWR